MSTAFSDGDLEFKYGICDALGLDSKFVHSITMKVVPDDVVMIEAELLLEKEQGKKLVKVLKKFHLVENKDGTNKSK